MVDAEALNHEAAVRILAAAQAAAAERGQFHLVLAGGNSPRGTYRILREADANWRRWHIWYGDERCLPNGAAERNSRLAGDIWLDHVPVPANQVHAIPAERGPVAAARAYAERLRGVGPFDLVLLGLGEDGHTASLFPGHDWGMGADAPDVLAVHDAPKPPAQRVSLSAARLGRSHAVLFLVAGEGKRDALARWRAGDDLPAAAIHPEAGVDVLLVDASASP
jgi:6-phosphogluconolactonase